MANLTRPELYALAISAGFSTTNYSGQNFSPADEIVAIAFAESGGDPNHVHVNGASTATINGQQVQVPAGTRDRGVLQINDWWNSGQQPPAGGGGPLVTDAQAFDPAWSFGWAFRVSQGGQMSLLKAYWVTAAQGLEKQFLTPGGVGNITPTPTPVPTPTPTPAPSTDAATKIGQAVIDFFTGLKNEGLL